jgi:hypothetical protein
MHAWQWDPCCLLTAEAYSELSLALAILFPVPARAAAAKRWPYTAATSFFFVRRLDQPSLMHAWNASRVLQLLLTLTSSRRYQHVRLLIIYGGLV